MPGVVIVAIPSEDDYVWKISSEKIPHMTLLYLGEIKPGPELARIESFLQHVADTELRRFYMDVDRRDELGPDKADVVFFKNREDSEISIARQFMLQDTDIRLRFNSSDQFPEWTPHLTLGYPATPAKVDSRDYPGINWVNFDKLALWVGDFEGPEFLLKEREEVSLAMSEIVTNILEHHGVKGQKWGVRKAERSSSNVTIRTNPGKSTRVKTVGGKGHRIHDDAATALRFKQKAKASGVHTLSNAELKKLVERLNLEQQHSRLTGKSKGEGRKFAEEQLKSVGRQKVASVIAKKAAKTAVVAAAMA